jgi:hypothetical protein
VRAVFSTEPLHVRAVYDLEPERELCEHLLCPLLLERGRAEDEDAADPLTGEQLLHHHAGLDRLAEADVVGDEQVHARHAQRPHHRLELEVLDLDRAPEGSLEREPLEHGGE